MATHGAPPDPGGLALSAGASWKSCECRPTRRARLFQGSQMRRSILVVAMRHARFAETEGDGRRFAEALVGRRVIPPSRDCGSG